MTTLEKLRPGDRGVIRAVDRQGADEVDLMEMGLTAGTPIEVVRFAPFGDPIELKVRGYHLSIRRADAKAIIVERPAKEAYAED
ncbi:MAG: ferrous iron transport protein A [Calditrichaeota bacterium]|nr:MAG: ferrous iron transport protein A [Calditrichota bacterium]